MDLDSFDFGADVSEAIDHIKVWPTTGEMTALVDGDLLPYIIGYSIKPLLWLTAVNRVESGEVASIKDTPEFEDVKQKLCMTMNRWITGASCDAAVIYMTDSAKNFRLDVAIQRPYKGTRSSEKPPFFYESREFMIEHLGAILSDGEEADDLLTIHLWEHQLNSLKANGVELGSHAHKEFAKFVICSKDKDLAISPGWHYSAQTHKMYWVTLMGELLPKWGVTKKGKPTIEKLYGTGLKFFYSQLLQGDGVDNYTGIPRYRLAQIVDLLDNCKTEEALYYAVLGAYQEKYTEKGLVEGTYIHNFRGGGRVMKPYEIMTEQGRLAHMQKFKGDIWRAKVPLALGSDESAWN